MVLTGLKISAMCSTSFPVSVLPSGGKQKWEIAWNDWPSLKAVELRCPAARTASCLNPLLTSTVLSIVHSHILRRIRLTTVQVSIILVRTAMALVPNTIRATSHAQLDHDHDKDTPSILRLPRVIRLRIFNWLGALPTNAHFINLPNKGAPDDASEKFQFVQTLALLLTSRAINEEMTHWLYSRNHFFERSDKDGILHTIPRLRFLSLESLRLLTVHLNVASCGLGKPCDNITYPIGTGFQDHDKLDAPLCMTDTNTKVTVSLYALLL